MSARPNVLWICTDQQRWDTIYALADAHSCTPTRDRLCVEGVAFTRFVRTAIFQRADGIYCMGPAKDVQVVRRRI